MSMDASDVSLGALANDVARLFNRGFDAKVRPMGLTRAQWKVLLYLKRRQGLSQTELGDLLEVRPPSLAKVLDGLERKGWLERREDPSDRRAKRLYLTRDAEPLIRRVHRIASEDDRQALADLSKTEIAELTRLMRRVKRNLSGGAEGKTKRAEAS